jgi:hypothetical protein
MPVNEPVEYPQPDNNDALPEALLPEHYSHVVVSPLHLLYTKCCYFVVFLAEFIM